MPAMHGPTPLEAAAIAVALLAAGALLVADRPARVPRRRSLFPHVVITASVLSIAANVIAWIEPQPWPVHVLLGAGGLGLVYAAHRRVRVLTGSRRQPPPPR